VVNLPSEGQEEAEGDNTEYDGYSWVQYLKLNKAFAETIIKHWKPGDRIWVIMEGWPKHRATEMGVMALKLVVTNKHSQ
jgi:long-subunit acyl-CoA synthetase (AMP-forming)